MSMINPPKTAITKPFAAALAQVVNAIRPDWDKPGIMAVCLELRDRDAAELTIAFGTAAKDPGAETPAAVKSPIYWAGWGQVQAEPAARPTRDPKCERFVAEMAAAAEQAAPLDRIREIRAGSRWPVNA
jgi:hypothetical protein